MIFAAHTSQIMMKSQVLERLHIVGADEEEWAGSTLLPSFCSHMQQKAFSLLGT